MAERKLPVGEGKKRKVGNTEITTCEILGPSIVDLIRAGMRPSMAAQAAGIAKSTVSGWIKRGSEEQWRIENGETPKEIEKPYLEFVQSMMKAEAEAQAGLVVSWFREARQGDWKAAQAFLSKRWPDEWGDSNTMRVEVSGIGGSPIQAQVYHSTEEDEDRKRAVLEALVEAGDLPTNVLGAWDGIEDAEIVNVNEGPISEPDQLEDTMHVEPSSHTPPEADGISHMVND